ncbi:MAG: ABC transporter permease, partial [Saprospiraceae bacterium]|nr:ABC transporter permease [Saprospiraceae bacterium]
MAITLGTLLCICTLSYFLLFKPLPYPEQDRLYRVSPSLSDKSGKIKSQSFSYPSLIEFYKNQREFSKGSLTYYDSLILEIDESQSNFKSAYVTPEWFTLFNAQTALGRTFDDGESINKNQPVVIISFRMWQYHFNSDPDIIDKKIHHRNISFKIVGVLSENFAEPELLDVGLKTDIWFPWDYNPTPKRALNNWGWMDSKQIYIGKLATNKLLNHSEQIISESYNQKWQSGVKGNENFIGWSAKLKLATLDSIILGDSTKTIYLFLIASIGLVVIAFVNIVNLYISKGIEQQRRLAIHSIVGARKKHISNILFMEAITIMSISTIIALYLSSVGFDLVQLYLSDFLPRTTELSINFFTIILAIFISFLFAYIFTLVGQRFINYRDLSSVVKSSGKGVGSQVSKRVRQILLVSQIATATTIIFVSVNLMQDSLEIINQKLGYNMDNVLNIQLGYPPSSNISDDAIKITLKGLKTKLLELNEVELVSQSSSPLVGFRFFSNGLIELKSSKRYQSGIKGVDDNYFNLLGIDIKEGRSFNEIDIKDRLSNIIINDVLAQLISPNESALGRKLSFDGEFFFEVIGIVKGVYEDQSKVV